MKSANPKPGECWHLKAAAVGKGHARVTKLRQYGAMVLVDFAWDGNPLFARVESLTVWHTHFERCQEHSP